MISSDLSDRESVAAMLREGLSFPREKRPIIWRKVLGLPCLRSAYLKLVEQRKLLSAGQGRVKENIILDFGCDLCFADDLVEAFYSSFENKELLVYEITRTILVNWCHEWILLAPNPPFPVLAFCSALLKHHLPDVFAHLAELRVEDYSWPLLSTFFSKVVEPSKWLELMDHIVANHPSFIVFIPVALMRVHKKKIVAIRDRQSLLHFFRSPSVFADPALLARVAYDYYDTTPKEIHPKQYLTKFQPLLPTENDSYPPAPQSAFAAVSLVNLQETLPPAGNSKELSKQLEGLGISVDWEHGESLLDAGFSTRKQVIEALRLTY